MPDPSYRLLQIFNRPLGGGGEELATREIARILSQDPGFGEAIFQSAEWTGPQAPSQWKQGALAFYNPDAIRRLRAAQAKTRAQAWILHNYIPVVSGGVFHEAQRQQVPILQYIHNFRPFSVSSYLWAGKRLDPAHWRTNYLREIYYGAWQNSRLKTAFLATLLATLHLTRQFRAIKAWVAVSRFMREKFIAAGVAPESIFQLYNPWSTRCQEPDAPEGDYYLFLARLIEEKGTKVVVNAWNQLRQLQPDKAPRLIIGGDGPLADWVKAAAAENPLIEFRGHVSGREKDALIQHSRGSIVPSIWWDPLPYVCYEAYDFGKPVLAATSGGLTELVQHGLTGFHHTPGDAEQLARQVLELDARPEMRRQMGAAGRAWLAANTREEVWRKGFFKIVDYAVGTMAETPAGASRRTVVTVPAIGAESNLKTENSPGQSGGNIVTQPLSAVGTSRCDVPARETAGGTNANERAENGAAERGADGAARHPYQQQRPGAPPSGGKPNLLVFEMRLLGDAVMSLPFIRAAKEKYNVFVCCQPAVSDVFRLLLPEEQVISWRPPWIDEASQYNPAKNENVRMRAVLQRLQNVRAQTTLCVWADARVHVLMAMTGAKNRIGFPMEQRNFYASELLWRRRKILAGKIMTFLGSLCFRGELLTQKLRRQDYYQHHVEDWRQMAEALDLNWSTALPWFEAPAISLSPTVSGWLRATRAKGQKIWLMHPGARTPERRWPMERFRTLAEQMFIRRGVPLIIINPKESPLPPEWAPGILIHRPAGLAEFFSLVNAVDGVVCNDTGVSHIAAALGKQVVCVFGPDLPQWLGPYHNLDRVVQKDACPYRPCFDRCVMPSYVCLEAVTVEMVRQMIEKVNLGKE